MATLTTHRSRNDDVPQGALRFSDYPGGTMSKKTNKRKIKARRKKANHGKKPNAGR